MNYLLSVIITTNSLQSLVIAEVLYHHLFHWPLLKIIIIYHSYSVSAAQLEAILRLAYNVNTLKLNDDEDNLTQMIFCNTDQLGIGVNQQIRSLQNFCKLICNHLPNLKELSFLITDSDGNSIDRPSRIADGKNIFTKRLVSLIHFLVNHLQQLVSLHIEFFYWVSDKTPCFPDLIRRQMYEWPLSRSYRLRCSSEMLQVWL
ncbi:unnamed protein product [Rotaria sp. Silwood1]|nr:unnamed protein product [Rotaria sp. Silwood1]